MTNIFKALKITVLVSIFICCTQIHAFATTDPELVSVLKGSEGKLAKDSSTETVDLVYDNPTTRSWINTNYPESFTNTVSFILDEQSTIFIPIDSFTCTVICTIQYTDQNGQQITINGKEFTINYNKRIGATFNVNQYFKFTGARKVKTTITSVTTNTYGSNFNILQLLRLESRMLISRDYNFSCSNTVQNVTHKQSDNETYLIKYTGTINANNATISNISNDNKLVAGAAIIGDGIPPFTTITSVNKGATSTSITISALPTIGGSNFAIINDVATITWASPTQNGITHYDVEWAWVDEDAIGLYTTPSGVFDPELVFPENSTRVTIPNSFTNSQQPNNVQPHYVIPILYDGKGRLCYRVRPVQYLQNGKIINGTFSSSTVFDANSGYFSYEGHQGNLNWQASTSYAEDGKRKTVIQYFDGTLRNRQTVTKDNTTNTTLVAETLYDYQGRAAIQILPAPTLSTIIQYAQNFNRFQSAASYQKDVYDMIDPTANICNNRTVALQTNSGAAKYYSPNNDLVDNNENKFIPDANGYPYTETRYSQDATGRIVAQGGVGPVHQLGNDANNPDRSTRYFYGSPSQKELDALFGLEVGDASHYFKNMVRDANGQYSVSYVDMKGQTIATALAGENPNGVDALSSKPNFNTAVAITESLLTPTNNIIQDRSIIAYKSLLVPRDADYKFTYKLNPQSAEILACNPSGNICYDCLYSLEITIVGNCNQPPIVLKKDNFSLNSSTNQIINVDALCSNVAPPIEIIDEIVQLKEGEYNITKKLTLSSQGQNWYKENIFSVKNLCKELKDFYDESFALISSQSDCNNTVPKCEACSTALGTFETFKNNFLTSQGIDPAGTINPELLTEIQNSYNENQAQCDELCPPGTKSKLANIRNQMLADVSPPNGQYAKKAYASHVYSIYTDVSPQPYLTPKNEFAVNDYYRDENNNVDPLAYAPSRSGTSNAYNVLSFSNPEQFEERFSSSWANSLLAYHPEYPRYRYAKDKFENSFTLADKLEEVNTWADAFGLGYTSDGANNDLFTGDPFFNSSAVFEGAPFKNKMILAMDVNVTQFASNSAQIPSNNHLSMWQIAYLSVFCQNDSDPNCVLNSPKKPSVFPESFITACATDKDKVWQSFKSQFLSFKNDLLNEHINSQIPIPNFETNISFLNADNTGYQRRMGTIAQFIAGNATLNIIPPGTLNGANPGPGIGNIVNNEYDNLANKICEGYKPQWLSQLLECDVLNNRPDKDVITKNIIDALFKICSETTSDANMMGSASRPNSDTRLEKSFEIAIEKIFAEFQIPTTALCHPYLVTNPKPYDKQTPESAPIAVLQKDKCLCDRLSEIKIAKTTLGFSGSLAEFIKYKYGFVIRQTLLDTLNTGCYLPKACNFYEPAIELPAILDCNVTLNTCISCDEYKLNVDNFHLKFPSCANAPFANPDPLIPSQIQQNIAFEQYMNYKTGFNKNWIEYVLFAKDCDAFDFDYSCEEDLERAVRAFKLQYPNITGQSCESLFVQFFNQRYGTLYNWENIKTIFLQNCGHLPNICVPTITCDGFTQIIKDFKIWYYEPHTTGIPGPDCQEQFTLFCNQRWGTIYTWDEIVALFNTACPGEELDVCNPFDCDEIKAVIRSFQATLPWIYPNCEQRFYNYFNNYYRINYTPEQILQIISACTDNLNFCNPAEDCEKLTGYITNFKNSDAVSCTSTFEPGTPEYCKDCFTRYMNNLLGKNYTYEEIGVLFKKACGENLDICENNFTCEALTNFYKKFNDEHIVVDCKNQFVIKFNRYFKTNYTYENIMAVYSYYCNLLPPICSEVGINDCDVLNNIIDDFFALYPDPLGYFGKGVTMQPVPPLPGQAVEAETFERTITPGTDPVENPSNKCKDAFTNYFNTATGKDLSFEDIASYYRQCGIELDICDPKAGNCVKLSSFLRNFNQKFGAYNYPNALYRNLFAELYNKQFKPDEYHTWEHIVDVFRNCSININLPDIEEGELLVCNKVIGVDKAFLALYPQNTPEECQEVFTQFFNSYYNTSFTYNEIRDWASVNCMMVLDVCSAGAPVGKDVPITKTAAGITALPTTATNVLPPMLCGFEPLYSSDPVLEPEVCGFVRNMALNMAVEKYNIYKEQQLSNFDITYQDKCMGAKALEEFTVSYVPAEYHYTLYYYNQVGNLVKTVPPAGVHPNFSEDFLKLVADARIDPSLESVVPRLNHTLATTYCYNTLGQVTAQNTPDAGISNFWYDRLGRLVVSQNSKQKVANPPLYSYTLYDPIGRITEVGEKPKLTPEMNSDISKKPTGANSLEEWLTGNNGNETTQQITKTVYDIPYTPLCGTNNTPSILCQQNLRNRVSYTYVKNVEDNIVTKWSAATFYSYDIHGNVDVLLQDYQMGMGSTVCGNSGGHVFNPDDPSGNRYKKITYNYDLISGKVNEVAYQAGQTDAFYHRYNYDAENRITSVETSVDKLYWEKDASYNYYKHGPLARTELGQLKVQGIDYAYTIQGWLKGVNSTAVNAGQYDIGADGLGNSTLFARDAFGFSLNYFNGDYSPIKSTVANTFVPIPNGLQSTSDGLQTGKDLFNGNIRAMLINIPAVGNNNNTSNSALLYGYRYDQLNRIVGMNSYNNFNNATNSFGGSPTVTEQYKERVRYDANGNIESYLRNADANRIAMDNMAYSYIAGTNKLEKVIDAVVDVADNIYNKYNDIKRKQPDGTLDGQLANNYEYDEIGNLIADKSEGIDAIEWTVYGKIKSISKTDGSLIQYTYDASGNRISKQLGATTTYYVRDASGNVMSVYQIGNNSYNSGNLTQTELHLYGSSRIGIYNVNNNVQCLVPNTLNTSTFTRGNKFFELSNHLGNVLVTISDKKIGIQNGTTGIIDYYIADVVSANDYYPFGMTMPGRKYSQPNSNYRYGFNGKENDNEVKGEGNQQDYGMRIYDPRLGKFLSVDPLTKQYPELTPYQFASNRPIDGIDLDGCEFLPFQSSMYIFIIFKTTNEVILSLVYENIPTNLQDPENYRMKFSGYPPLNSDGTEYNPFEQGIMLYDVSRYNHANQPFNGTIEGTSTSGISSLKGNAIPGVTSIKENEMSQNVNAENLSSVLNIFSSNGPRGLIQNSWNYLLPFSEQYGLNQETEKRDGWNDAVNALDSRVKNGILSTSSGAGEKITPQLRAGIINFMVDGTLDTSNPELSMQAAWYGTQILRINNISIQQTTRDVIELTYQAYKDHGGTADYSNIKKFYDEL